MRTEEALTDSRRVGDDWWGTRRFNVLDDGGDICGYVVLTHSAFSSLKMGIELGPILMIDYLFVEPSSRANPRVAKELLKLIRRQAIWLQRRRGIVAVTFSPLAEPGGASPAERYAVRRRGAVVGGEPKWLLIKLPPLRNP